MKTNSTANINSYSYIQAPTNPTREAIWSAFDKATQQAGSRKLLSKHKRLDLTNDKARKVAAKLLAEAYMDLKKKNPCIQKNEYCTEMKKLGSKLDCCTLGKYQGETLQDLQTAMCEEIDLLTSIKKTEKYENNSNIIKKNPEFTNIRPNKKLQESGTITSNITNMTSENQYNRRAIIFENEYINTINCNKVDVQENTVTDNLFENNTGRSRSGNVFQMYLNDGALIHEENEISGEDLPEESKISEFVDELMNQEQAVYNELKEKWGISILATNKKKMEEEKQRYKVIDDGNLFRPSISKSSYVPTIPLDVLLQPDVSDDESLWWGENNVTAGGDDDDNEVKE